MEMEDKMSQATPPDEFGQAAACDQVLTNDQVKAARDTMKAELAKVQTGARDTNTRVVVSTSTHATAKIESLKNPWKQNALSKKNATDTN